MRMDTTQRRLIPVALLAAILIFGSGCATSQPPAAGWEYKVVQRLDYPGLNDESYRNMYAWPWQEQLNLYEQQGWSVDSVSVNQRELQGGQKQKSAKIVLKRAKK
jgi:hypothetical protein